MESTAILIVAAGFGLFALFYGLYVVRRGKATGKTDRTWCLPRGHGDIGVRRDSGAEMAPKDTCPPRPERRDRDVA